MTKDLEYYRRQPYSRSFEIPTIAGDGATKDEALRNLRDAFDDYITWALAEGLEIADASRLVTLETTPAVPSTSVAAGTGTKITSAAPRTVGPATRRLTAIAV